ncbi:hypothetical protein [uncultured Tenacibaculum sp.]|uniref:hypothetical protein n=1 Tax=uncultured Tenacibaculum sp. TaxID=174713 RepID=UPI0026109A7B|nr:hypothetical protein [uncultured Tenacibaculum sp.]
MKKIGSQLLLSIIFMFFINKAYSNAAQPGIWNAGGTVFTMLYPEDSLSFKKVQMQQENIYIQLYKGFAVVKGVYWFRNTTNDSLRFKMGYPTNGIYAGGDNYLNHVTLDSLSQFKIRVKNNLLPLFKEAHPELNKNYKKTIPFSDNWKVWNMEFTPNELQKVEVYFIVNTNNARVKKGYESESKNAFIYLLESGSVWKNPIKHGDFYIELMDGLNDSDIKGLSSGFDFRYNETHKLYTGTKTNFSPTPKDNLVITYHQKEEAFSFENILLEAENLFITVDKLAILPLNNLTYNPIEIKSPYDVKDSYWISFPTLLVLFVTYSPIIIISILFIIIIWATIKWLKIKRRK